MGKVGIDKSMSLDGYIAGANPGPDKPLGEGGDRIFGWMMADPTSSEGATKGMLSEAWEEMFSDPFTSTGAVIMGKRMFEIIDSPNGWVAPNGTAFPWLVFVLTHDVREPETKGITRFTFVNGGPESALAQARAVAGDKNIGVAGGTSASSSSPPGWSTRSRSTSCPFSSAAASACSMASGPRRATWSSSPASRWSGSLISSSASGKPDRDTHRGDGHGRTQPS